MGSRQIFGSSLLVSPYWEEEKIPGRRRAPRALPSLPKRVAPVEEGKHGRSGGVAAPFLLTGRQCRSSLRAWAARPLQVGRHGRSWALSWAAGPLLVSCSCSRWLAGRYLAPVSSSPFSPSLLLGAAQRPVAAPESGAPAFSPPLSLGAPIMSPDRVAQAVVPRPSCPDRGWSEPRV